ncbi:MULTISPECIES: hypothetical protein [Paenibacillus]|uniref:Uncharacterized protein n=1 Tax=Paenibacillus lutrae TaxID=2078573 RepID=A0A7X3FND3_9BACL|nr:MULTISPECIES: hypothetical protein [Paenibacillus]MVP02357.1 hypothetical protein [Paenibacillus lutrae]
MAKRKSKGDTELSKLDFRVKVLLKEWAGFSGFYGYKSMEFDEILALVNTNGWTTTIDASDPSVRIVEMVKEDTVRKAKFSLDDKGRALKNY